MKTKSDKDSTNILLKLKQKHKKLKRPHHSNWSIFWWMNKKRWEKNKIEIQNHKRQTDCKTEP